MTKADETTESTCFSLSSHLWVFVARNFFFNQKPYKMAMVIEQLSSLRVDLKTQLAKNLTDITENKKTVCNLTAKGSQKRDVIIIVLLKKSLAMKKTRDGLVGRINTIEMQIEALESSDFNRNMLKTMQSTTDIMRKMGLEKGLSQADSSISELEENMQMACDMNSALSSTSDYLNDDQLDAELDELMDSMQSKPIPDSNAVSRVATAGKVINVELPSQTPVITTEKMEVVTSMVDTDGEQTDALEKRPAVQE
jgi:hypothetical protein